MTAAHRFISGSGVCIRTVSGIAYRTTAHTHSAWSGARTSEHRTIAGRLAANSREVAAHPVTSPGHGRHRARHGSGRGGTPRSSLVGTGLVHGLRRALSDLFERLAARRTTVHDVPAELVWTITVHPTLDDWL